MKPDNFLSALYVHKATRNQIAGMSRQLWCIPLRNTTGKIVDTRGVFREALNPDLRLYVADKRLLVQSSD